MVVGLQCDCLLGCHRVAAQPGSESLRVIGASMWSPTRDELNGSGRTAGRLRDGSASTGFQNCDARNVQGAEHFEAVVVKKRGLGIGTQMTTLDCLNSCRSA
jgi:hypothetical protein